MTNSPFPGGPSKAVDRDEPNRRGGKAHGNQSGEVPHGDLAGAGNSADRPEEAKEGLVRGAPPKPGKRYSLSG